MYRGDLVPPVLRSRAISFLSAGGCGNAYTLSDLESSSRDAEFLFHGEGENLEGIMMRYPFRGSPVIWLHGSEKSARHLVDGIEDSRFVLISDSEAFAAVQKKYPGLPVYPELVMSLDISRHKAVRDENAIELTMDNRDAALDFSLMRHGDPVEAERRTHEMIMEGTTYGYFAGGSLVSIGRIDARSSLGWVVGGIYTLEAYRGMGYSGRIISAIASAASGRASRLVLFVRENNLPAVMAYRKAGFRTEERRYFVDFHTGSMP